MIDLEEEAKTYARSGAVNATVIYGSAALVNGALTLYLSADSNVDWKRVGFFAIMAGVFSLPTGLNYRNYSNLK